MNFCCETYTNLGCLPSCVPLSTGIMAPTAGTYEIYLQFNNAVSKITVDIAADGDEIILVDPVNENYIYKMKIFKVIPGTPPTLEELGCYRFSTSFINTIPTT